MIERVEFFIRQEDKQETIRVYEVGKKEVKEPRNDNPSARRGGMVVEYKNGNFVSVAQHKGITVIYSSRTNKEYKLSDTHFLDVVVFDNYTTLIHCDPEYKIFLESLLENPVANLKVIARIKEESGNNFMEIDFEDKNFLKKLNKGWLNSYDVDEL